MRSARSTLIGTLCLLIAVSGTLLGGCSPSAPVLPFGGHAVGRVFTSQNWGTLDANPDVYKGAAVSFVGKVAMAYDPAASPPSILVFAVPKSGSGITVVAVFTDPGVKAGQYVAVVGKVIGRFTGRGPFSGSDVSPVLVQATSVEATSGPPESGAGD